ncbi:ras-like GTP-binding protein RHO [Babylonia areolata]|uniref:ras-like GTP-binding protein RHO n=1 Tax=Babylonia areolata TaxID=304850 RepID=UPI003FD3E2F4
MFCCFRGKEDAGPKRLKMVIVGDGDCGKSCLLYRFAHDEFFTSYVPTVFDVEAKTVHYKEKEVQLVMYDTAGQETYDRLRPLSYDETDVALLCFSLDNPDSLENVLLNWLPEVRYFCGNIPILLVGNKKDLRQAAELHGIADQADLNENTKRTKKRTSKAMVSFGEGQAVGTRAGAVAYFETSALTGEGTDAVFEAVVRAGMEIKVKKGKSKGGVRMQWKKT